MVNLIKIILFFTSFLYSQGGGYALEFDGVNDNINIGDINNLDGASTFTIEFWFDINNLSSGYSFINKRQSANQSSIQIKYHTTKGFIMEVETGNNAFGYLDSYSTDDEWVHACVVFNGNGGSNADKLKLYLNGIAQTLTFYSSLPSVSHSNSNPVYLGSVEGSSQFLPGKMDEIRFWDDVRTASEIQENMHKDMTGSESNLVAYYKMSDGTGTSLTDNSSNSNTGTLTSMDNSDWVTSQAPIGNLGSSYKTDVEGIWKGSGTSESDASNGLTMTVGSALSTGNFAVFGNNNVSVNSMSDLGSVGSTIRTGRIWQVDESGTVAATIKIDISDATGLSNGTGTASNYRLLYRSGTSGAFSSAATGSSISGDVVTFNSVSLQDGYYALGAESDATLPVELTSFELLETRNNGITLQWVTESEINNLGFNLDRKTPITDWSQIASYVTHPALQGQGSVSHQTIYTFTDNTVQENESYDYRLSDVDYDGNVEYHSLQLMGVSSTNIPEQFILYPNYPNPFNPVTTIRYDLPKESFVDITVYDMLGNVVYNLVNTNQSSGYKSVQWNAINNQGEPVSAGVYLYKIQAENFVDTKKMILLK